MTIADCRRGAVLLAVLLLAAPAGADEPQDRLFQAGALADLPAEAVLTFSRQRSVPEGAELGAIDGALTIRIADRGTSAAIRFDEPECEVRMPPVPTSAGHPALLVFLESTVSSLASISGGSPFYIKNRFIESFARPIAVEPVALDFAGAQVEGERMLFRPFEGDPNSAKLGPLAGLELAFVLSDAVPGGLASASATGGGYSHSLTLDSAEVPQ